MSGGSDASSSTQTQLPQWLSNYSQQIGQAGGQNYGAQQTGGYNPMQQGAATTSQQYGQMAPGALGNAYNALSAGASYTPDGSTLMGLLGNAPSQQGGQLSSIGSGAYNGSSMNPTASQAQTYTTDPSQLGTYQSGQLSSTNLSPYLNPYTQDVTNTTMAGLNQQLAQQQAVNDAGAANAGAFGGSRAGVQAALTNQAGQQTAASTLANLNQSNYSNAQQAALTDIGNQNTASQFNAGALNTMLGQNMAAQNAGSQFNAGQSNSMTQNNLNDYTSRANATASAAGQAAASANAARASMYNSNNSLMGSNYSAQLQAALGLLGANQNAVNGNISAGGALQGFGQQGIGDQATWGNQIYNQGQTNLGGWASLLGSLPYGQSQSTQQQGASGNPWAGALGGASAGSSFGPWGTAIGAGVGYLGSQ